MCNNALFRGNNHAYRYFLLCAKRACPDETDVVNIEMGLCFCGAALRESQMPIEYDDDDNKKNSNDGNTRTEKADETDRWTQMSATKILS